jgi:hypothetical protein
MSCLITVFCNIGAMVLDIICLNGRDLDDLLIFLVLFYVGFFFFFFWWGMRWHFFFFEAGSCYVA